MQAPSLFRQAIELLADSGRVMPPDGLGEVFDLLIWRTTDNGGELCDILREWLDGTDEYRVRSALAVQDVFLKNNRPGLEESFLRIGQRWPSLAPRCEQILANWDEAHRHLQPERPG